MEPADLLGELNYVEARTFRRHGDSAGMDPEFFVSGFGGYMLRLLPRTYWFSTRGSGSGPTDYLVVRGNDFRYSSLLVFASATLASKYRLAHVNHWAEVGFLDRVAPVCAYSQPSDLMTFYSNARESWRQTCKRMDVQSTDGSPLV